MLLQASSLHITAVYRPGQASQENLLQFSFDLNHNKAENLLPEQLNKLGRSLVLGSQRVMCYTGYILFSEVIFGMRLQEIIPLFTQQYKAPVPSFLVLLRQRFKKSPRIQSIVGKYFQEKTKRSYHCPFRDSVRLKAILNVNKESSMQIWSRYSKLFDIIWTSKLSKELAAPFPYSSS